MDDLEQRVRRASERVTPPDRPFDRLLDRRRRKARTRRLATVAIAGGLALVVVGAALTMLSGLWRGGVQPAAREAPAMGRRLDLDSGEYLYLRIRSAESDDGHVVNEQTWWGLDGSGEIRNDSTRRDKYPTPESGVYGAGDFPVDADLSQLSTDPDVLADQLNTVLPFAEYFADGGVHGWPRLLDVSEMLLLQLPNATPELRAALFEVEASLPGVRTVERVQDPVGREATALTFTNEAEHVTWTGYFDPATRQLMASTTTYRDNAPYWTVLDEAVVRDRGVQPTSGDWLFRPSAGVAGLESAS